MGSGPSIDSLDDDCHDGDDDDDDGDGASECMKSELRLHKVDHRPLSTRKCKAPEAPIKQETQESLHMKAKARALHMTIQLTDFEERYQRFELIGQGGHGKVYKCKSKNAEDNKLYAVKDVDLNRLKLLPGFDKKKLRREINVLMSVQHPNIVYCWECFESKNNHFLMLLDFCDGKDLVDLVIEKRTCNQSFTEFEAKGILRQINNALGYLHANNIMHRDLKCDNIRVLNKPAVDNVKLLDFGYSKYTGTSVAKSWAG
jgi:serine/threonine protein kinase